MLASICSNLDQSKILLSCNELINEFFVFPILRRMSFEKLLCTIQSENKIEQLAYYLSHNKSSDRIRLKAIAVGQLTLSQTSPGFYVSAVQVF